MPPKVQRTQHRSMNAASNGGDYQIANWPKKDIEAHIGFMIKFSKKLAAAGELVGAEGLAPPTPGAAEASAAIAYARSGLGTSTIQ